MPVPGNALVILSVAEELACYFDTLQPNLIIQTQTDTMVRLLTLAGLAYAGYYAYSKLSPEKKQQLADKGRELLGKLPLDKMTGALGKAGF